MAFVRFKRLLQETEATHSSAQGSFLAGAVAYQAILSVAPLFVIAVAIAGAVFGADAARAELEGELRSTIGPNAAAAIADLVATTRREHASLLATVLGVTMMLLGAGGLFGQLQDALNLLWGLSAIPAGLRGVARQVLLKRFVSFFYVLLVGAVVIALLASKTFVATIVAKIGARSPAVGLLVSLLELLLSGSLATLLIAIVFRYLPDGKIAWRHSFVGAAVTAAGLTLATVAVGLYLARVSAGTTVGAAGSFTALLLWVLISTQVFFWGAAFTVTHARVRGSGVHPEAHAFLKDRAGNRGERLVSGTRPRTTGGSPDAG